MPPQIGEQVHGMLNALPGCVKVTSGPQAATASDMECPAGHPQPTITKTIDSTPVPTANPAIGQAFGNKYNKYLGCGNDNPFTSLGNLRLLNADYTSSPNMTVEYCQSYCTGKGYRLSGTKAGTQCYCDLAVNPSGTFYAGLDLYTGCANTCPGNPTELCGAGGWMNVYNNTDPKMKVTNNTANSVIQLTVPIENFKKNYLGCYSDPGVPRTLNGSGANTNNMTNGNCAAYCTNLNYSYYGTEYAEQCYCG